MSRPFYQAFRRQAWTGLLIPIVLSATACDYWPPGLQSHIEELRAELNDALDDRQRLDLELMEMKTQQASLQREVEEKARENEVLQERLASLPRAAGRTARAANYAPPASVGTERVAASFSESTAPRSSLRKGAYFSLQMEQPPQRGPRVAQLQRLLRRHAFPIRVDGIYGPSTDAAIRSFQRVHGLLSDGVVGPRTYRALHAAAPAVQQVRQLRLGPRLLAGRDVSHLQRALRRAGYHIPIDGHFGRETKRAVIRFQRSHGLQPDGIVGPRTWAGLKGRG